MLHCKHCHAEITAVCVYQAVQLRREITIVEGEAFVPSEITIEYPKGKPRYHFRCKQCGGDLSDDARHWTNLLRRHGVLPQ